MAKKMAGQRGASATGSSETGNSNIYGLMHRRAMRTTGEVDVRTNSHEVGDYIPRENLPEYIVGWKPEKSRGRGKGTPVAMKPVLEPANAEKLLTGQGRRGQMRLVTNMRTGARDKKGQGEDGCYPTMSGGGLY